MEELIWTLLGYIAMPTIFVIGFAAVAAMTCFVLDILDVEIVTSKKDARPL